MTKKSIITKPDELGRFVIPVSFGIELNIRPGDDVDLFYDGDKIFIRKIILPEKLCNNREFQ